MRIEICGCPASGKTSIVDTLEQLGFHAVHEPLGGITFVDEFYANPDLFKFETEISFLLQHSVELKKAMTLFPRIICDYSFELDYAYAANILNTEEIQILEKVFHAIKQQIKEPELILRLQCSTNALLERIRKRGREIEQNVTKEYLDSLDTLISRRLSDIHTPVLCINTETNDFRNIKITQDVLLPLIRQYIY